MKKNYLREILIFALSILAFLIIYSESGNYLMSVVFTAIIFAVFHSMTKPKKQQIILKAEAQNENEFNMFIHTFEENICKLSSNIEQMAIGEPKENAASILSAISKIEKRLKDFPSDYTIVKEFAEYYLPTISDIIAEYNDIVLNNIKGEKTTAFKLNVEQVLPDFKEAVEKQLEDLYEHKIIDTSIHMTAMKRSMQSNGLIDEFKIKQYK